MDLFTENGCLRDRPDVHGPLRDKGPPKKSGNGSNTKFAHVAQASTAKVFLAVAASCNYEVYQLAAKTAFLQTGVEDSIYVTQLEGFEKAESNGEELVCRLHKSRYRLH